MIKVLIDLCKQHYIVGDNLLNAPLSKLSKPRFTIMKRSFMKRYGFTFRLTSAKVIKEELFKQIAILF